MSHAAARRRSFNAVAAPAAAASWAWVTHAAFVLAVAVMVARVLTPGAVRDPWAVAPGGDAAAGGPGAATGLAFDLLAAAPALLVLARRCLDRGYRLAWRPSHGLLVGLAVWVALSATWASDRYAAVVSAADFAGGACLLWAASQLVRSWDRLRVVAAVSLGLLLALAAHTVLYRSIDLAETRQYWTENRAAFLKQRGWAPDSFQAVQFGLKLTTGEQTAFYHSANTLAAVGVLLAFAAVGLGVQRAADDRDRRWLGLSAVAAAALAWVLLVARSKTSLATPPLGVAAVAAWWAVRRWIWGQAGASGRGFDVVETRQVPVAAVSRGGSAGPSPGWREVDRRHAAVFAAGVAIVVVAGLAVVGLGVARGGLFAGHFSNSLDFRWKYWTASAGIFAEHPLVGVGWENFGRSYLAHRVPEAAEEIQDPHNFLVRFGTELGAVGLALAVGWLLRLAWELTRPATDPPAVERPVRLGVIGWIACGGVGLSVLASSDLSAGVADSLVLLMRPVLLLLAIVLGGVAGAMRSPQARDVDGRPGPWVFAAVVVGLGLFGLHNLIDFAGFEPGAMFAFMTLAGAALGVAPAAAARDGGRAAATGGLAVGAVAWVAVLAGVAVPVGLATAAAAAADDVVRAAPADHPAEDAAAYRRAADGYEAAVGLVPYDGEMVERAADAAARGGDLGRAARLVTRAERVDPRLISARLLDASLRRSSGDVAGTRAAYDAAVSLDPNDVPIRLQYADAMASLGQRSVAAAQYRAALAADAALPAGEPRRLSAAKVAAVRAAADR